MKLFFLIAISSLLAFTSKKDPLSKQIDSFVKKEMKELGIPGMAVTVIKDGKILHQGTYGIANSEWNLPVSGNTAFQIASVTKLFTSTLVMKMIQEQKIKLEDPVSKFFPDAPASWKTIRVDHLLSHQSGIPWPASIGGFLGTKPSTSDKAASKEQIYKDMTDSALTFQPGTKESYINGDAFVLQMIIEKIYGKKITEIFEQELFAPLKMSHSGFDDETRNFPAQVMRSVKNKTQLFTKGKTEPLIYKTFYNPASYCSGGLYMSPADATKWAIALDKGEFLDPGIIAQLKTKMPLNGSFTALGWNYENMNGHAAYGHSGGPGLGDILRFPDEKLTIIVFSNYADMYPYMAASIARFYFPDIQLPDLPKKALDRGYDKLY